MLVRVRSHLRFLSPVCPLRSEIERNAFSLNKEVGMFPRCRKPISEGESGQAGDQDLWVTSSAIKLNSGKWTGSDWMDRTRLRPQGDSTGGPSNKCGPVCDRTRAQPRRSPRLSGTGWDRQNVQALKRALHKGNSARQPAGRVYNSCLVVCTGRVCWSMRMSTGVELDAFKLSAEICSSSSWVCQTGLPEAFLCPL